MNTPSAGDAAENLKEKGSAAFDRVKEAAKENVIDPAVQAGKDLSEAADDGASKVADYGRHAAHSVDEWVEHHPFPSAGVAFTGGIVLGLLIGINVRH